MSAKAKSEIITRADLQKSYKACARVESEIWNQLVKRSISDVSPSVVVIHAVKQLQRPAWIDQEAWENRIESISFWALAHGSLAVWKAAGAMEAPKLHFWLAQQRKKTAQREEARYLFASMEADLIGDEELL